MHYLRTPPPPPILQRIMAQALAFAAWILMSRAALSQITITEIMFDPIKDRGCEYVEIYNPTDDEVGLRFWRIVDATGRTQATFPKSAEIAPHSYLVIAADTLIIDQFPWLTDSSNIIVLGKSGFGLNSDGDAVVLADRNGIAIDRLAYDADWHRPDLDSRDGTSLERASLSAPSVDARNWSSSVGRNGGTPGAINSIALPPRVVDADIDIHPATVSPDADGFEDVTRISYRLPTRTARITMTLHDRHGRLLARLINNELSGADGELVWNAFDVHGMPLAPDVYLIRIEAYDAPGIGLVSAQTGVVVARR
ncbi:MAG: lamin tail domain-containing protein [bacterium]|nr:lamin tail domain-containing protein [Candidatus Kapabacteria bacterium]